MHTLENVIRSAVRVPWCIVPEKLDDVLAVLTMKANGERATVEAIHAATAERRTPRATLGGAVAIIPVHGVIAPRMNMMTEMSGGTSAEQLANQIRAAVENPQISAIVLDVDSPGGQAAGMSELSQKIRAWRDQKYIVAISNYMMGSAAYCIASAATEVVASPDSETGSIGTYAVHTDVSQADAIAGVKRTLVKAGIYKAEEASWFPLTDEARAHMQETVDAYNLSFLTEVAANRRTTVEAVRAGFGQGRMLTAKAAMAAGLVDRILTMDDLIVELAGSGGPSARVAAIAAATTAHVITASTQAAASAPDVAADDARPDVCPECGDDLVDDACPTCDAKKAAAAPAAPEPIAEPLPIAAAAISTTVEAGNPASTASGRGASVPVVHIPVIRVTAPKAKETKVSEENTAAHEGADTRESEVHEIEALASVHAVRDQLPKWIEQNTPLPTVRAEIAQTLRERLARGPQVRSHAVDLSPKEERQYSYARAIISALDGTKTFESEYSQEVEKTARAAGYLPRGGAHSIFVPTTIAAAMDGQRPLDVAKLRAAGADEATIGRVMAAGLDSGTSTKGPEIKVTQYGGFIPMLRNKARVLQAGATFLQGLTGPVTFGKQTGAGTFAWVAENGGSDVSESNLLLGTVTLTPKTGMSSTSFSRQLLRLAVEDVELLVRNDIAAIHALGIDSGALLGSGSSNQPTGIYNQAGVGVVALGTNGLAPTYANCVNMQVQVGQANADEDLGAGAYITTPGLKGTLQTTQKFSSTNGDPVWGDNDLVAGRRGFSTNQVQSTLTKGSGTNLHAMYYGIWQNLLIGEWGALEIVVDPLRLKKQGMIEVTSFEMIDIAARYAGAFSIIKDAISTF